MRPNIAETWILGSGMGALLVAALVVNLIVPQFEDVFRGFGAELPWLTTVFARHRRLFFLLPLLPPLLWWAMARHAGASVNGKGELSWDCWIRSPASPVRRCHPATGKDR